MKTEMRGENRPSRLEIVREHNSLNGLRIVVVEFLLVIVAAGLIGYSGMLHGRVLTAIAGIGICGNALAVIGIAGVQIRNHDRSEGVLKVASPQFREKILKAHPDLTAHTVAVLVWVIVPFLLLALLLLERSGRVRGGVRDSG